LEKVWNVKQKKVNFNYSNIDEFIKLNEKLIKNYKAGCNNYGTMKTATDLRRKTQIVSVKINGILWQKRRQSEKIN